MENGKAERAGPPSSVTEHWAEFVERLRWLNDRLLSELENCWQDVRRLLQDQLRLCEAFSTPDLEPPDLHTVATARARIARELLHEPFSQWERRRLDRQVLMAIELYDRRVEDAIRALPETISVNGPEAIALLGEGASPGWWRLAALRRAPRSVPLRALIEAEFQRQLLQRLEIEGHYFLALTLAIRAVRRPWEVSRTALDASVMGRPIAEHEREAQLERIRNALQELTARGEAALAAWRRWCEIRARQGAHRLLTELVWRRRRKSADVKGQRAAVVAHGISQLRAAEAEIRLECEWERVEDHALRLFQEMLKSAIQERADLLTELDDAREWLRQRLEQKGEADFPPPRGDVVPAISRLSELEAKLKAELESLPPSCEILVQFSALPRRRIPAKKLQPRTVLHQSFMRKGRADILSVFREIESTHREIIQEIERAREVVTFALEVVGSEHESEIQAVQEALQNALSLLEYKRREVPDWRAAASSRLAQVLASIFVEARMIAHRHRVGVLAYLAQQGLRRAVALVSRSAATAIEQFLRHVLRALEHAVLRFLVSIGWKPAPTSGTVEVITRPFLPEEFIVDLTTKELPALYRRLFRFEPVQDPRFLVGRQQELEAIAEARSLWEAGRPVALIIVGQQGSGKTSLINCAVKGPLEGLEVIRGEFTRRLITEPQLRGFLAKLIEAEAIAQVEESLLARRRVVILEELERTFLRQVGGYGAIRALQRVIAATCSSTLWILTINQTAFQFLQAAVNLGSSFSHRLNVGTASRDDLRQAILLRHTLSGLRLQFPPPPVPRHWGDRVKRFIQGPTDAESLFFEALARESAGVYRTAFEIWLGHIERVEAGILYMKPLAAPDLSPVIDDLDVADLFALVAILQHGSLTPEEHAVIFQTNVAASRSQMDELLAREIIENDPHRPGFRIRPEALRVVREALYRRNLL